MSKMESSCFPPCEGYESNNADLSSTANQGVIAGANTTNIGFTGFTLSLICFLAMQLARSLTVKLVVLVQEDFQIDQKDSVASEKELPESPGRNISPPRCRVTPSNVVRKLGFSNSWFCWSFQLLGEEDNWQHTRKFWGRTCDFSKSTRLWTRLTLVQFFLSWSGRFKGPAIKKQTTVARSATFLRSAKSGNAGLGANSLVCAISCCSWHSKVIQKFYGLMARRNTCTNHELLCFTGRGFKICASDVT